MAMPQGPIPGWQLTAGLPVRRVPEAQVRSVKASAGFFGLAMALHLCGEVDVYGFDSGTSHYYKKRKEGSRAFGERHSWHAEQSCVDTLQQAQLPHVRIR